jgi:hypothetical protein
MNPVRRALRPCTETAADAAPPFRSVRTCRFWRRAGGARTTSHRPQRCARRQRRRHHRLGGIIILPQHLVVVVPKDDPFGRWSGASRHRHDLARCGNGDGGFELGLCAVCNCKITEQTFQ